MDNLMKAVTKSSLLPKLIKNDIIAKIIANSD